jgi:hypothetical protein
VLLQYGESRILRVSVEIPGEGQGVLETAIQNGKTRLLQDPGQTEIIFIAIPVVREDAV